MVSEGREATGNRKRRKTAAEIDELIIEQIQKNPSGVTFSGIQEGTKLPPSVLSKHLKMLTEDLRIEKSDEGTYRVEGMGAYRTILKLCIKEIDDFLGNSYDKGSEEKLKFALDELVGSPGKPVPMKLWLKYTGLADINDVAALLKFAEKIIQTYDNYTDKDYGIDKKYAEYSEYLYGVINFAIKSMIESFNEQTKIPKEIWRIARNIEKELFNIVYAAEREERNEGTQERPDEDSQLLREALHRVLQFMAICRYPDMWDIIESMINCSLNKKSDCDSYYSWLLNLMLNSPWLGEEYVLQMLHSNQGKLFSMAINSINYPARRDMLQKLRKYVYDNKKDA
jgi:DNA-binding transcriptional ArsR family regulator